MAQSLHPVSIGLRTIFAGCESGAYQPHNPPPVLKRYLFELHSGVLTRYGLAVQEMSEERALQTGHDGRTVKEVVDHITEWDRWTILSLAERATGVEVPSIMCHDGYMSPKDAVVSQRSFLGDDNFNDYIRIEVSPHRPWSVSREMALDMAVLTVKQAYVLPRNYLEGMKYKPLYLGENVELTLPYGWYLWAMAIHHQAVEHAEDIYGGW